VRFDGSPLKWKVLKKLRTNTRCGTKKPAKKRWCPAKKTQRGGTNAWPRLGAM
jgi:hypothetical protein